MFDKIITWGELITIVLFVLGSILLFYLILAVSNLLKVLKSVNKLIDDNKDNIDKSLKDLPKITENTEKATALIKDNLEGIDKIVEKVGSISTSVKDGIDTIQNDIILKAKSILEIVDAIKRLFEKRKAKSEKKKKNQEAAVYKYKYKAGMDEPENIEVQIPKESPESHVPEGYVKDEFDDSDDSSKENADSKKTDKKVKTVEKALYENEAEDVISEADTETEAVEIVEEFSLDEIDDDE